MTADVYEASSIKPLDPLGRIYDMLRQLSSEDFDRFCRRFIGRAP